MGYQDCPCVNCDHKADGEKRVACRKKCTEFTAWKLSMQAIRQKRKVLQKKPDEAKKVEERYGRSMQSLCRTKLHGHLCRSGALQTRVPGNDRPDKAADNKS